MPSMTVRRVAVAAALAIAMHPARVRSQQLEIRCDTTPVGCGDRVVRLDSARLHFLVAPHGSVRGLAGARVSVEPDAGTVDPPVVLTGSDGRAAVTWHRPAGAEGTATVVAIAEYANRFAQYTYRLRWTPPVDTLYLRSGDSTLRVGIAGHTLPHAVRVVITGVRAHGQAAVDECERQRVVFTGAVPGSGEVGGRSRDTVGAVYDFAGDATGAHCFAGVRWRLADVPGEQRLHAALIGPPRVTLRPEALYPDRSYTDIAALASEPAHLVIGLASTFRRVWSAGPRPAPPPPGADSSAAATPALGTTKLSRVVQPFIGVDFTLQPALLGLSPGFIRILDRLRWTLATPLLDPGRDGFIGLALAPLFIGSGALDVPMQVVVGTRVVHRGGHFFVGVSYDATGLVSSLTSILKP